MSVIAEHQVRFNIDETLDSGAQLLTRLLLQEQTTAGTKQAGGTHQLTAGAETLDLTAIANQAGGAVDFTSLKIKKLFIRVITATAEVVFAEGASSGYALFAGTAGKCSWAQGEFGVFVFDESREDVDATHKTIDVSSTDLDAIYEIYFVAG